MFDDSLATDHARRLPSGERAMRLGLRPVVTRTGSPRACPERASCNSYTSRPPSRSEMKSSDEPSGANRGLVCSAAESVTATASPPAEGTTRMLLGATFPVRWNCQLPRTKAIHFPSADHVGEWMAPPAATAVLPEPSRDWITSVSRFTYAIRRPSGDHAPHVSVIVLARSRARPAPATTRRACPPSTGLT